MPPSPSSSPPHRADEAPLSAAQLAEAFALFNRASEELSGAYNALQAEVAQLSERFSVLMGALPAGVVVVNRNGRVEQVNRAAEALLGAGLTGKDWQAVAATLQPTESPGELLLERADHPDGARRLVMSENALESGEGHILLLQDVTETHLMRLAAERNERLAAMGEMVAGLAHQLRTPLAAALLYTGNLRQPELGPLERMKVAERAIERLRYLERLIRDMLLFARGDSLGRQDFAVNELLAELTHTLEPLIRSRQIRFSSRCNDGGALVHGDRKALGGALTNLLENAIQATAAGGEVDFEVNRSAGALGEEVSFVVRDRGRGIEADVQARLFEPFFTTRAEGTGLGLAIARGVARGHGGDIRLESTLGAGSTFTLTLPLLPVGKAGAQTS
ncbi:PAS domain-containing sensor histidine kinase [Betaproteobacteria bacterium]|nr:PAS domain-containing sensor histidine kinase [Betaproteobacteria bacterium]GHT93416.1 PAS domain-containing sensor histidine kinase [Betaproteobacteria bacterium]GHT97685.1 PAS domain-containing sensor histidine kinase [Betaproteobacteria bacterium]GHU12117.1 PAS domain-containing sensor histidine kinase [Betaproteobacteria bacterium]GHU28763.1 PAS domain-containing sensor histidine kinase [Betaproteobacteria bacterium]